MIFIDHFLNYCLQNDLQQTLTNFADFVRNYWYKKTTISLVAVCSSLSIFFKIQNWFQNWFLTIFYIEGCLDAGIGLWVLKLDLKDQNFVKQNILKNPKKKKFKDFS